MGVSIRLEFDRPDRTYRVGERVGGFIRVTTEGGARCREISLTHSWETHGLGNVDRGPAPTPIPLPQDPLPTATTFSLSFEFQAPMGPLSYHGRALEVDHHVRVEAGIPGAPDIGLVEEFILVPGPLLGPPPTNMNRHHLSVGETLVHGKGPPSRAQIGRRILSSFIVRQLSELKLGSIKAHLSSSVRVPGEPLEVEVRISPKQPVKVTGASLELRAQEVCVSGTGPNRTTSRYRVFSKVVPIPLPGTLGPESLSRFGTSVTIPDKGIYSFVLGENALAWEAVLRIDVPLWPDWEKVFPLLIWPSRSEKGAGPSVTESRARVEPEVVQEPRAPVEPEVTERPRALARPEVTKENGSREDPSPIGDPEAAVAPKTVILPEAAEKPDHQPLPSIPETPEPTLTLQEAVLAIQREEIFGGSRDRLIKGLLGKRVSLDLTVARIERTFALFSDAAYRNGRTVTGSISGTGVQARAWFPEIENDRIDALEPGITEAVTGTIAEFDRLSLRPTIRAQASTGVATEQG